MEMFGFFKHFSFWILLVLSYATRQMEKRVFTVFLFNSEKNQIFGVHCKYFQMLWFLKLFYFY